MKKKSPRIRWTLEAISSFVRQIGEKMWVPDPDKIDLPLSDTRSGPQTNLADGRSFYWARDGRTVVRCWLTDVEEDWLGEVFKLLEDRDPQTLMRARYNDLQSEMTDLFNKIRRYRFGLYVGELESIRGLQDLIFGNAHIDLGEHRYATTDVLIDNLPSLRGKVEIFCRDLNFAVLDLAKLES